MTVRIKICGITRIEDALLATELGAHALGFVFHPASPRAVSASQAAAIVRELPPFVSIVGLFVNADPVNIRQVRDSVALDLLQFHGDETPAFCNAQEQRHIKAIRMAPGVDLLKCAVDFGAASALLLDAHVKGAYGGTGQRFDWSRVPAGISKPVILSGGLEAANVADGICAVRPFAVDVSSGVESAPGIKDPDKLRAFIREAQHADV